MIRSKEEEKGKGARIWRWGRSVAANRDEYMSIIGYASIEM